MVTSAVERCAIHLAELDPTRGREIAKTRPVVIVSQEDMNRYLDTVVVCPLTTKLHPRWRSRIQITCAGRKA
jgi:mRNA interferase MazF